MNQAEIAGQRFLAALRAYLPAERTVVVTNIGLHFHTDAELTEYARSAVLVMKTREAETRGGNLFIWRETNAQHFSYPGGLHPADDVHELIVADKLRTHRSEGLPDYNSQCDAPTTRNQSGPASFALNPNWRNLAVRPIIGDAFHVIEWFSLTRQYWRGHVSLPVSISTPDGFRSHQTADCTHICLHGAGPRYFQPLWKRLHNHLARVLLEMRRTPGGAQWGALNAAT